MLIGDKDYVWIKIDGTGDRKYFTVCDSNGVELKGVQNVIVENGVNEITTATVTFAIGGILE